MQDVYYYLSFNPTEYDRKQIRYNPKSGIVTYLFAPEKKAAWYKGCFFRAQPDYFDYVYPFGLGAELVPDFVKCLEEKNFAGALEITKQSRNATNRFTGVYAVRKFLMEFLDPKNLVTQQFRKVLPEEDLILIESDDPIETVESTLLVKTK